VAYQLVLRDDIYPATSHNRQQQQEQVQQPPQQKEQQQQQSLEQYLPSPTTAPIPEKLVEENERNKTSQDSAAAVVTAPRKGGKPPELPPKPKFTSAMLSNHKNFMDNSNLRKNSANNYSRSNSVNYGSKTLVNNRLHSESNLASLQATKLPSMPSSVSISSTGSGRAPLAAKDEL